jgi:hypothetical protein
MKQYLWVGLAIAFVSASASDNPFDLKENFGKLDQDQEVLLSELKKIAAKKALVEEKAENVQAKVEEALSSLKPKEIEENTADKISEVTMEETSVSMQDENKSNMLLLEAVKEKEAELKRAKEEARKLEEAKKEAERREVEAYEKQRAEKLARKLATDKAAKELIEAEKEVAQKELLKKEHSEENISVEVVKEKVSGIVDINLTQENEEAKKIADQAYEEAVSEMSQED